MAKPRPTLLLMLEIVSVLTATLSGCIVAAASEDVSSRIILSDSGIEKPARRNGSQHSAEEAVSIEDMDIEISKDSDDDNGPHWQQYYTDYDSVMEERFRRDYMPTGNYTEYTGGDGEVGGGGEAEQGDLEDNCTHPRQPFPRYNDSCDFVHAECGDKTELIDYLAFVLCDLPKAQPFGYVVMATWLLYLISLLATTVDHFFVPPLTFLSEKLRLSPSVAGVTLMALGNGAPDIFVVFSGIAQNDLALVLGSLTGAAIFITTVVMGTVLLISKVWPYNIDKIDFMRDITALTIVIGTVIGVAFDGAVYLVEACVFPLIYFVYIAAVIIMGYIRNWLRKRSDGFEKLSSSSSSRKGSDESEKVLCSSSSSQSPETCSVALPLPRERRELTFTHSVLKHSVIAEKFGPKPDVSLNNAASASERNPLKEEDGAKAEEHKHATTIHYLPGLSWPKGAHLVIKIIWLIHWPFSLLRWFTIPPFYHDNYWSMWHYLFASFSPVPISILLLIAVKGWSGFLISVGPLPLPILLILIAIVPSLLLFVLLRPRRPPHCAMQFILVPLAFLMAIVWLNIMANEIVSVMRAFGLLLSIDTAVLGLTVLALGNCVADWVADTVVTRAGKPEMAFASCFGSPLLSHVLGLSVAMIVKIGIFNHGEPFRFYIHTEAYSLVKLSWIFLGVSLVSSAIIFPSFKFSPPRLYGVVLIGIYLVFVVVAMLGETHVLPFSL